MTPHLSPAAETRVLVLDGEWPSTLAIVRSLGRRGFHIDVGAKSPHATAACSRYRRGRFIYPDPLSDIAGFRAALQSHLRGTDYAMIIPVTDETICPLMEIRESIEELTVLPLPANDAISVALSKSRTAELARSLNVPTPMTWVVRSLDELAAARHQLTFPLVVKPDRSKNWLPNHRAKSLAAKYVHDSVELERVARGFVSSGPAVLQEFVRGDMMAIAVVADRGRVAFAYQHRCLHAVPITGGSWSYRVTEAVDSVGLQYVSQMVNALQWTGVAEFEFKVARTTGTLHLLEINGRFWFSLPLAVAAGADFPAYLYDLFAHEQSNAPRDYRIGVRGRNFVRDLAWTLEALKRDSTLAGVVAFPSYRTVVVDWLRALDPRERLDAFSLRDPLPVLCGLMDIARRISRTSP